MFSIKWQTVHYNIVKFLVPKKNFPINNNGDRPLLATGYLLLALLGFAQAQLTFAQNG